MLGFHGDALILSGPAGSQLKSSILGDYYEFWWKITSGGPRAEYAFQTAVIDLNAGTGELYVEDTGETILGSAGHALWLKYESGLPTQGLRLVLVEEDEGCYLRLRNVIMKRWPDVPLDEAEGPPADNRCGVYLLNLPPDQALSVIEKLRLGNSIFLFDPLLHVEWDAIARVARTRIKSPFKTGTEFLVFVFTSDWFTGREYEWREPLAPLPTSHLSDSWTSAESSAVEAADSLFGDEAWRSTVLQDLARYDRQDLFIDEYRKRLLRWFRWVLPLPFMPREGQLYHLLLCSNYEDGVRVTRDFFCDYTGNPRYSPSNPSAYKRFRQHHPETLVNLSGNQRPVEWKVLWQVIRTCEGGVCDSRCRKLLDQGSLIEVAKAIQWLQEKGYLHPLEGVESPWRSTPPRYCLDWNFVSAKLGVDCPPRLEPIRPGEVHG